MKFATLWVDSHLDTSLSVNIGNDIQFHYAIHQLYREMGIPKSDIIPVCYSERSAFSLDNEEKLIFPINEALFSIGNDRKYSMPFPLHDSVVPVFIGISLLGRTSLPENVINYLRKFEPIGCRDEFTVKFLRSLGVEAYLFGCISLTLPLRESSDRANNIVMVDVPEEFSNYIPEDVLEHSNFINKTHELCEELNHPCPHRRFKICEELLGYYATEAKLIVTSRLHCAVPCVGMGIPTVYVSENHSKRLAWIDKLLPVYTRSKWKSINWNASPIDVNCIKNLMHTTARSAIECAAKGHPRKINGLAEISEFWTSRPNYKYDNYISEVIEDELTDLSIDFKYIIWGVGIVGEKIYQEITEKFPNSKMILAVDSYVRGEFHGIPISLPEEILRHKGVALLVATFTGKEAISKWINNIDNDPHRKCVFFSTTSG